MSTSICGADFDLSDILPDIKEPLVALFSQPLTGMVDGEEPKPEESRFVGSSGQVLLLVSTIKLDPGLVYIDQVVPFEELLHPVASSIVEASTAVDASQVGENNPPTDGPGYKVLAPTTIMGAFDSVPGQGPKCRVYKIVNSEPVLQSVGDRHPFKAVRSSSSGDFRYFAHLPPEVRAEIVSTISGIFFKLSLTPQAAT